MRRFRWALIATSIALGVLLISGPERLLDIALQILRDIPSDWWWYVALAVAIQLAGHGLRMLRTKTVLDQVNGGSALEQFGALGIGYLFNMLLPLRLGELLRASVIAMRLNVSFLYTFAVITIERATDLFVVGVLVIFVALLFSGTVATTLLLAAIGAIILSVIILLGLVLLVSEDKRLLTFIWHVTSWLNPKLSNSLRFKVWSLIFGLQQFMRRKQGLRNYGLLALASWACYIASVFVLALPVLQQQKTSQSFVLSASPYVSISASPGPAYIADYDNAMKPIVRASSSDPARVQAFIVLSWIVLTLPMALIGFVSLFLVRFKPVRRTKPQISEGFEGFSNKLLRRHDLSQEFPAFLDTYFAGENLSHVLHEIEVAGELSLVRFFKGGSDAITVLVLANEKLFVKKIIPSQHEDRLKAQYDWLRQHKKLAHNVEVLGEHRGETYYAIDLAYDAENIPYFEYAHHHSLAESQTVLIEVWKSLYDHLHAKAKPLKAYPAHRQQFVDKHIFGCAEKAAAVSDEVKRTLALGKITINGKEYDNLYQVMAKIKKNKQAWSDIATYQRSGAVHGDLSIDNILVSARTNEPLIIDPAPDGNIIEGPVFDMGKLMQSFYCGYEFLFRDENEVHLNPDHSINYSDHRSDHYAQLCKFVQKELAPKYLSDAEQRALIFHAGALHIRRLKHQALSSPGNTLKFYAVGVKTLNEFLAQYAANR